MGTASQRRVTVGVSCRSVALDTAPGETRVLTYSGLVLTRHGSGEPRQETWLPMGEEPTEADDEALIAALHEALLWSGTAHQP